MKMKFKGTPGNWSIIESASNSLDVVGDDGYTIVSTYCNDQYIPELHLANAKLIAAAPELLEAASEALELLNAMRMTGNVTALKGTIDKLQAAISKALK